MLICRVIGHVWATKKEEALSGQKLMVVQEECTNEKNGATFVAADSVSAGIGEQVLVVTGSTARRALGTDTLPIDSAIVGIIDEIEVAQAQSRQANAAAPS